MDASTYNQLEHDYIQETHIWLSENQICGYYRVEDNENKHNQRVEETSNWVACDKEIQKES